MLKQLLKVLQARLKTLEFYKGAIDGIVGSATKNAVIEFKRANGLTPRDLIGPLTMAKLYAESVNSAPKPLPKHGEPLWLTEARRLLGTREIRGSGNNSTIMDWADQLDQWYPGDDVPWCGLFVAHCMAVGAPNEPQGFNRLGARAWRKFGEKCDPQIGAIAVFWRTHRTKSFNGHVAFIVGEDSRTWHVLGGNQSDSVSITKISKNRLLQCRCPVGWSGTQNMASVAIGAVSQNEA